MATTRAIVARRAGRGSASASAAGVSAAGVSTTLAGACCSTTSPSGADPASTVTDASRVSSVHSPPSQRRSCVAGFKGSGYQPGRSGWWSSDELQVAGQPFALDQLQVELQPEVPLDRLVVRG